MGPLKQLRQWAFNLRKKLRKPRRRPLPVVDGLPSGVEDSLLQEICRKNFLQTPVGFSYQHLSAWKSSGAYRIFLHTHSGNKIRLIYKESCYSQEEIPALQAFPAQPGPAEFAILSHAQGELAAYLPGVYWAEERSPNQHYRYFLEDLELSYRQAFSPKDVVHAARLLPEFQQAMCAWSETHQPAGLIRYGLDFSHALETYTLANLKRFVQQENLPVLEEVLRQWRAISEIHLYGEFFAYQPRFIHGDSNYTNIHLHKSDPTKMKLVDWEWAGFSTPYADLVSLLKGVTGDIEQMGYQNFQESVAQLDDAKGCGMHDSPEQSRRMILWCQLERGLIDAGFLAAQHMGSAHKTSFSLPKAVSRAAERVLLAYQELAR